MNRLFNAYKEWRRKRRWNAELQLEYLRQQVALDYRWMAHDPKIRGVCQRYLDMLADDWEKNPVMPVDEFRRSIDCAPHFPPVKDW